MKRGFFFIFFGMAIAMLVTIPLIFAIPRCPTAVVPAGDTESRRA